MRIMFVFVPKLSDMWPNSTSNNAESHVVFWQTEGHVFNSILTKITPNQKLKLWSYD